MVVAPNVIESSPVMLEEPSELEKVVEQVDCSSLPEDPAEINRCW